MIRLIKDMQAASRFSFICFLFVAAACVCSATINLILRFSAELQTGFLASVNTLVAIPASFVYLLLFILPGLFIVHLLIKKNYIKKKHVLLISITLSSLLAYLVFWVYFLNHIAGRVTAFIVILLCIFLFFFRFKSIKDYIFDPSFIKPLTICFIVGCMYSGILLLYGSSSGDISAIANNRFFENMAHDNIIPRIVFDMAYNGSPLYMIDNYWFVSDRPPVASAITLLLYPLNIFIMNPSLIIQFLGMHIQLLWIPVLYCLCDFFSLSGRIRSFIILCAVFSGVFLINSVYVWPKLSTTVYFCLVLFLTFELADEKKNTKKAAASAILIGIATAMAILTHGGIMFSFIALGMAIIICEKRFNFNYRDIFYSLGSFAVMYLPWQLFSRYQDPSGNKLLKLIFAGPGAEHLSLTEGVMAYYTQTHVDHIFTQKFLNIFDMFVFDIWQYATLENIRAIVFAKSIATAAVLNVFLVIAVLYFLYRFCFKKERLCYKHRVILWFTILSFTVWPLLMNTGAILYQGSYFNLVLLFLVIAFGVKYSSRYIAIPVFIINIIMFIFTFVLYRYQSIEQGFSHMNVSMLALTLLSFVLLFAYFYFYGSDKKPEENNLEKSSDIL
ncbi:MAG: hypothetical protein FWD38_01160 [Oscillospiraceae bacterium]|nr:hypothetical protein [Oscillospiraceae bacterium]